MIKKIWKARQNDDELVVLQAMRHGKPMFVFPSIFDATMLNPSRLNRTIQRLVDKSEITVDTQDDDWILPHKAYVITAHGYNRILKQQQIQDNKEM